MKNATYDETTTHIFNQQILPILFQITQLAPPQVWFEFLKKIKQASITSIKQQPNVQRKAFRQNINQ